MKTLTSVLIFSLLIFLSCTHNEADKNRHPLLEVDGMYLYADEVQQIIPPNIGKEDSVQIAQSYIKKWVTDILLYDNAKRNISNQSEIDELVDNYRKSLMIHQYQQKLIEQRLPAEPSEEELKAFYDKYSEQLILKDNIIKGLLLVVPQNARNIANVRSWVQSGNTKSLENIDKYSLQNAISYDYFGNKWIVFSEILRKIPLHVQDPAAYISKNRFVEVSDSLHHYFLRIDAFRIIGEVEPFEMSKSRISNILQNKLKADFINQFEKDLYDDAVDNKTVKFFRK